jgi:hypothetical protein
VPDADAARGPTAESLASAAAMGALAGLSLARGGARRRAVGALAGAAVTATTDAVARSRQRPGEVPRCGSASS